MKSLPQEPLNPTLNTVSVEMIESDYLTYSIILFVNVTSPKYDVIS